MSSFLWLISGQCPLFLLQVKSNSTKDGGCKDLLIVTVFTNVSLLSTSIPFASFKNSK
jgi:hypothetical protein